MIYQKITAIFRQVEEGFALNGKRLGGIARIETVSGISDLYLSLINFSGVLGDYFAFAVDGEGKVFKFSLGKSPSSTVCHFPSPPDLEKGIAVGICLVKDGLPLTIAFSKSDEFMMSLSDFKKRIASELLNGRKQFKQELLPEKQETNNAPPTSQYNDEAVATVNYFDFEESIKNKLKIIEESDNDLLRFENELPSNFRQEKETKTQTHINSNKNEKDSSFSTNRKECRFYDTVKAQLDKIFLSYPREEALENAFLGSRFAKIAYSDNSYYVVGIIKEEKEIRYICYGVPSVYSASPPEELKGFCSFIPSSIFNLKGEGYWMAFQDATTGKRIIPE